MVPISSTPLFSTYRQGENRITSSILAVFERVGLSLTEEILSRASSESTLETVAFTNQPATGTNLVPDARISADFTYLFEVKTARGTVDEKRLRTHLKVLGAGAAAVRPHTRCNTAAGDCLAGGPTGGVVPLRCVARCHHRGPG